MPTEETAAAAEQVMAPVPDKGKKIAEVASEEKNRPSEPYQARTI
jgi:hypothetical protein